MSKAFKLASDPKRMLSFDAPSLLRLDQTYGPGSASSWLYDHLKQLFVLSSVYNERLDNSQIEILSEAITAGFPHLRCTEFMLFEVRFICGHYERFFGETSYILVLTRSLNAFLKDIGSIYSAIEGESRSKQVEEVEKKYRMWKACREELKAPCSDKESRQLFDRIDILSYNETTGEVLLEVTRKDYEALEGRYARYFSSVFFRHFPGATLSYRLSDPVAALEAKKDLDAVNEAERRTALENAHRLLDNAYDVDADTLGSMKFAFKKRYGMSPERYIEKFTEEKRI